ncbi:MAG: glyceraldehyde-3-phosphate dehydrogenase [Halioglobus sp.]
MPPFHRPVTGLIFAVHCAALIPIAHADLADQFFDPVDGRFDASGYLAENAFGFLPVPVIITEPALDYGLGLTGLFFHEDEESAEQRKEAMLSSENAAAHLMPPSVSAVFGAYTGNDSFMVGGAHMGFFNEGRLRYQGGVFYGDINLEYYSLGGIELDRPLSLSTEAAAIFQTLKFKVADWPVFVGPTQRYVNAELSPAGGIGDLLPPGTPPELEDSIADLLTHDVTTSGLGFIAEFDSRDNLFSPSKGFYYDFAYVAYRDGIGSDIDYDSYTLSGLNYFLMTDKLRGGIRLEAEVADSDDILPPFAQPGIDLRGIPAARYQGTHVGVVEAELTWDIDSRWSVLGFGGVGRAASSGSDMGSASSRVSKGLGFRYEIARRYGFHMGIDVARGPEDTVWYIQAGSAW